MNLTLILHNADKHLQCVFEDEQRILCGRDIFAASRGTERLAPAIGDMLKELDLLPAAIRRIVCSHGPAGFTGLRLILTTTAAFRRALGIPVASFDTLLASAASVSVLKPSIIRVLSCAHRGLLYAQDFMGSPGKLPQALGTSCLVSSEKAFQPVKSDLPLIFSGSGAIQNLSLAQSVFQTYGIEGYVNTFPDHASFESLTRIAESLPDSDFCYSDPEPIYLKDCDAVDNLGSIAKKRGQSPDEAYQRLRDLLRS
ncbi:MAG: tRNA (adenosine(37)-N6)-threonylcarbamoyltransferase complex dimerization subunit type 1 TsaB [Desulfovibrionaceae bacterium]|nr:tRNA (adenosine(37)-N6)-threonylcarbamoyltransferase complex dimerization subunit type 1 TsaB [Desulfovibrionaceae bacterium]